MEPQRAVPRTSSEDAGCVSVSEIADTTQGPHIAADAGGVPVDDAACCGDALEEWFARAAGGDVSDEGDSPGRILLAAATLPVHDAMVCPPRVRRGVLRALGTARLRRVRGRVLAMTAFVSLLVVAVVTAAVTGSLGSSSTSSPTPEVVTSARAPIDKLGDRIERSLTVGVARETRARQRRHTALRASRRKANERRPRGKRRVGVARHQANGRGPVSVRVVRALVPPSAAGRGASRARVAIELGEPGEALQHARRVRVSRLPVPERRAHHLIDVATAHGQSRQDSEAVALSWPPRSSRPRRCVCVPRAGH
jgi:hypothetical protein